MNALKIIPKLLSNKFVVALLVVLGDYVVAKIPGTIDNEVWKVLREKLQSK